tara:strand:+ start:3988 stop:4692 length:705 start_codon:yes stop_codon:yes gene_type:complete
MALPKLNNTQYELQLPSTGESIKFRPWLIKEQKLLMMAQESDDAQEIERAFANIVTECTFGAIEPYSAPMFDIEYIFLKLRGKSVGDSVKLNVLCPDDEKTRVEIELNLEDVGIQMKEEHTNVIDINDSVKIVMRYPTLKDMTGFDADGKVKQIFSMIASCISEIHDGKTVYNKVDTTEKEMNDFVESFSQEDFEKLTNFFDTMPKLLHEVEVKNPKTKKKNNIVIEGLESFFV